MLDKDSKGTNDSGFEMRIRTDNQDSEIQPVALNAFRAGTPIKAIVATELSQTVTDANNGAAVVQHFVVE